MNFKSQWQYYKKAKAQIVLTNAVTGLSQSIHCITWRLVPPVRCKIPIQSTNMESPGLELQRICLHGLRFLQLLLKARNRKEQQKGLFPINLFEFPSVMTNKPVTNWSSFGPRSCSLFFFGLFFVTKGTSCNATELDLTKTLPLLDSPKGSASNHSVGDTPSLCKVP